MLNNYIKKLPERRYAPQEFVYMGLHLSYTKDDHHKYHTTMQEMCGQCDLTITPIQTCGKIPCYMGMHWKLPGK